MEMTGVSLWMVAAGVLLAGGCNSDMPISTSPDLVTGAPSVDMIENPIGQSCSATVPCTDGCCSDAVHGTCIHGAAAHACGGPGEICVDCSTKWKGGGACYFAQNGAFNYVCGCGQEGDCQPGTTCVPVSGVPVPTCTVTCRSTTLTSCGTGYCCDRTGGIATCAVGVSSGGLDCEVCDLTRVSCGAGSCCGPSTESASGICKTGSADAKGQCN